MKTIFSHFSTFLKSAFICVHPWLKMVFTSPFSSPLTWRLNLSSSRSGYQAIGLFSYLAIGLLSPLFSQVPTAGLQLWLKSDTGVTLSGTTNVTKWADQSGKGNDAVQTTTSLMPVVVNNAFGAKPSIRFDGSDDYLEFPQITGRTAIVAVKHATGVQDYPDVLGSPYDALFHGGSGELMFFSGSSRMYDGIAWKDGVSQDPKILKKPTNFSVMTLQTTSTGILSLIGSNYKNFGRTWNGEMLELLVYDRVLTETERQSAEAYIRIHNQFPLPAPVIAPAGQVFSNTVSVTMSSPATGATIRYTTNGTDPTSSSTAYTTALTLSATTTVKAKAFKSGEVDSGITTKVFTKDTTSSGVALTGLQAWYRSDTGVTLSGTTNVTKWSDQSGKGNDAVQTTTSLMPVVVNNAFGAKPSIRFDGSDDYLEFPQITGRTAIVAVKHATGVQDYPDVLGSPYDALFHGGPGDLMFFSGSSRMYDGVAWKDGVSQDPKILKKPTNFSVMTLQTTSTGILSLIGSNYKNFGRTWNGEMLEILVYDRVLTETERQSAEAYIRIHNQFPLPAPVIAPAGQVFSNTVSVTMSSPATGATIRYTTNGTDPTSSSTAYTTALTLSATTTVKAKAFKSGEVDSGITTKVFTKDTTSSGVALTGLQVWYRSDTGVTLSGTTNVTKWSDQSGKGNDAVQTTTSLMPVVVNNAFGAKPSIRFDGSDDYLEFPQITGRTAIVAVKHATGVQDYPDVLGSPYDALFHGGPGDLMFFSGSSRMYDGVAWKDGVSQDPKILKKPTNFSVMTLQTTSTGILSLIGSNYKNFGRTWNGEMLEILVYDRVLTDTERQSAEASIRTRYESLLPANLPTFVTPPGFSASPISVAISGESGATVRYTTNGTDPTDISPTYTSPIPVTSSKEIRARSYKSPFLPSNVLSGLFSIGLPPSDGDGLSGTYFAVINLTGTQILRKDPMINFGAGFTLPAGVPSSNFSARWTGSIKPRYSETYTFYTNADDGTRLWVNNQLLIDDWGEHGTTERSGTITLVAGQLYDIKLEYFQGGGGSNLELKWSSFSNPKEIIPTSQIYSNLPNSLTVATPMANPAAGAINQPTSISLTTASTGATIRYTTDGTTPTAISTLYAAPIPIAATTTIKALGIKTNYNNSGIFTGTYTFDNLPPTISSILFNAAALANNGTVATSGTFSTTVSDTTGISKVEFWIDGALLATDTTGSDGYSTYWNIDNITDGSHTLIVKAFDTFNALSSSTRTFTVALAVPTAPILTAPTNNTETAEESVTVRGTAPINTQVFLYRNNIKQTQSLAVASDGTFQGTLSLLSGVNTIQGTATNRGGESAKSTALSVTLNTARPSAPLSLTATAQANGQIGLTWAKPSNLNSVTGYNLYRKKDSTFTTTSGGTKLNSTPITTTSYTDAPTSDGTYFYRVTAISLANLEGDLSNDTYASRDASVPTASVVYEPQGPHTPAKAGPGQVLVTLTASELLDAAPFFSIVPQGGLPISVPLTINPAQPTIYTGKFTIDATTPSGTAQAGVSMQDHSGNRGTTLTAGNTLVIDTAGPKMTEFTVTPVAPIKNVAATPVTLTITGKLDEALKPATNFSLLYSLSNSQITPTAILNVVIQPNLTFSTTLTLPSTAGQTTENLSFSYSAQDELGNLGTTIVPPNLFQIYQGTLPKLDSPLGLAAEILPAGKIRLTWKAVEGAVDYEISRKTGTGAYVVLGRTNNALIYTDTTPADALYTYRVAAIRTANGQESVGSFSTTVSATSDRVAPAAVTLNAPTLTAQGVSLTWTPATGDNYQIYRSATAITTITGLTAINSAKVTTTSYTDPAPDPATPYYALVSADAAGNLSPVSNSRYMNSTLLPVRTLALYQEDTQPPVITWSQVSSNLQGTKLLAGEGTSQRLLTPSLLPVATTVFVDPIGLNQELLYTAISVDQNNVESLPRSVRLPKATIALASDPILKRSLPNRLIFNVTNNGTNSIAKAKIQVRFGAALTSAFSDVLPTLAPGATSQFAVVVADPSSLTLGELKLAVSLISEPNPGEYAELLRTIPVTVADGSVTVNVLTRKFTRGGTGFVQFSIFNPSAEEIELVVAQNNGTSDSPDVRMKLLDNASDNLLTIPVKFNTGDGVVNLPNGDSVLRIPSGFEVVGPEIQIAVPSTNDSSVNVSLEVDRLYYHRSYPEQVQFSGGKATQSASLVATSYDAQITSITPKSSEGDQPIQIQGKAFFRDNTAQAASNVLVNLRISNEGFVQTESILTDSLGKFTFTYTPDANASGGSYSVTASHPDLNETTPQDSFTIARLIVDPKKVSINIPRNYTQKIPITVKAGSGLTANQLRLQFVAADQLTGNLPAGITVDPGIVFPVLASGTTATLEASITANNLASQSGKIFLRVVSTEGGIDKVWQKIEMSTFLSEAAPAIQTSTNFLRSGGKPGQLISEKVTLSNIGLAAAENLKIRLIDMDRNGALAPSWITMDAISDIAALEVGATREIGLYFNPSATFADSSYNLQLEVTSINHPKVTIPVIYTVRQDGVGSLRLHLVDERYLYINPATNLPDPSFDGVVGAQVQVVDELTQTEVFQTTTLADGLVNVPSLNSGRYKYRVTAEKHAPVVGFVEVRAGTTNSEEVLLTTQTVSIQWEVVPTTITDKYDIRLNATYETDVPVATLTIESSLDDLSSYSAGTVYNGEAIIKNVGLIRADDLKIIYDENSDQLSITPLNSVPESLEAGESFKLRYKVEIKENSDRIALLKNNNKYIYTLFIGVIFFYGLSISRNKKQKISLFIVVIFASNLFAALTDCAVYKTYIGVSYSCKCKNGQEYRKATIKYLIQATGNCYGKFTPQQLMGPGAYVEGGIEAPSYVEFYQTEEVLVKCTPKGPPEPPKPPPEPPKPWPWPWWPPKPDVPWKPGGHLSLKAGGSGPDVKKDDEKKKEKGKEKGKVEIDKEDDECTKSWVNLSSRDYRDYVVDLDSDSFGSEVGFGRYFMLGKWNWVFTDKLVVIPGLDSAPLEIRLSGLVFSPQDYAKMLYKDEGKSATIQRNSDGTYRYSLISGYWSTYSSLGQLTQFGYNLKTIANLSYKSNGFDILTPSGFKLFEVILNSNGTIFSVKDAYAKIVKYEYDSGNLSVVTHPDLTQHHYYYANDRMVRKTSTEGETSMTYDSNGDVTSVQTPDGNKKNFSWDYDRNKSEHLSTVRYNDGTSRFVKSNKYGKVLEATDPLNQKLTSRFDGQLRYTIDELGREYSDEYNSQGLITKENYPDGTFETYEYHPLFSSLTKHVNRDGTIDLWEYDAKGLLIKQTEASNTALSRFRTWSYNSNDQILIFTDFKQNQFRNEYNTNGKLWKVYLSSSSTPLETYTYDSNGYLGTFTDALGRTTNYLNDIRGRALKITHPDGTWDAMTYDNDHLIQSEQQASLTTRGVIMKYSYNAQGRVETVSKFDPILNTEQLVTRNVYSPIGELIETQDALGTKRQMAYDASSRVVQTSMPKFGGGTVTSTNEYGPDGKLNSVTAPDLTKTVYAYDLLGRKKALISAFGTTEETGASMEYDNLGNLITETLGNNTTNYSKRFQYDARGRVIRQYGDRQVELSFEYDSNDNLLAQTDLRGVRTSFEYDVFNRNTTVKVNGRLLKTNEYDAVGNLIKTTDGELNQQGFYYDSMNRLTKTSVPMKNLPASWWSSNALVVSTQVYNANGQLEEMRLADGSVTSKTYDSFGRVKTVTAPNGQVMTYFYTLLDQVSRIDYSAIYNQTASSILNTYDSSDPRLLVSVQDRNGKVTTFQYDAMGRKIAESSSDGSSSSVVLDKLGRVKESRDSLNRVQKMDYNLLGLAETLYAPDHTTANPRIQRRTFDSLGRLLTVTGSDAYPVTYTYDSVGNRLTQTDGNNKITKWDYNELSQMTKKTYANNSFYEYSYDSNGNMLTRKDALGKTTRYTYNDRRALTDVDYPTDTDLHFTYDSLGRQETLTDASGTTTWGYSGNKLQSVTTLWQGVTPANVVQYGYHTDDSLASMTLGSWTITYDQDSLGRLSSLQDNQISTQKFYYDYLPQKNLIKGITFPNGAKTTQSYDLLNRLLETKTVDQTGVTIDQRNYGYNLGGQRETESAPDRSRSFTYNDKRELLTSTVPSNTAQSESFAFDPIGNWLNRTLGPEITIFTPNNLNQYTSITVGATSMSPQYDLNGNMTSDGRGATLTYDEENRLIRWEKGTVKQEYGYDGLNHRVWKKTYQNGSLTDFTRYLYDGGRMIAETDPSGLVKKRYTRGLDLSGTLEGAGGIGGLLAFNDGFNKAYYLADGNGNIVKIFDHFNQVVAQYQYSAFGQKLTQSGALADLNPMQWSSKEFDVETSYSYYLFRFYNPELGRWINRDPIQELGGVNLYGFVGNRFGSIDPFGFSPPSNDVEWGFRYLFYLFARQVYVPSGLPDDFLKHYMFGDGSLFRLSAGTLKEYLNKEKILSLTQDDGFRNTVTLACTNIKKDCPKDSDDKEISDFNTVAIISKDFDAVNPKAGMNKHDYIFQLRVQCNKDDTWTATGIVKIEDRWDFDYTLSNLFYEWVNSALSGEVYGNESIRETATLFGSFLPGTPFDISTEALIVTQRFPGNLEY